MKNVMMNNYIEYNEKVKNFFDTHQDQDFTILINYKDLDNFKKLNFQIKKKMGKNYWVIRKKINPFKNTNNHKRYYTLDYYLHQKYQTKIAKIPINAGFTCPNIDGTKGFGGCSFCSIKGSGDFAGNPLDDLEKQWQQGYEMMAKKWPNAKYIAYFQAFTNTYAPIEILKKKFEYFVNKKTCAGLNIATRADCLDEEIVKLLAKLNQQKHITIEIGLQTIHQKTAEIINRGHDLEEFETAINLLKKYNLETVVHIINGLPKETYEMMLETAKYVGKLNVDGIKIHLLHVTSDTILVNQLNNGFLELLDEETYVKLVSEQLTYLPENMVIHRITGDAPFNTFIGPIWSKKKFQVINNIDKYMELHNLYQGKNYED